MDALFVAIVATCSVSGCFKGLIKSFCCLLAFSFAILLAFYFTQAIVPILNENGLIKNAFSSILQISFKNADDQLLTNTFSSQQEMLEFINQSNLPNFSKETIVRIVENNVFDGSFTVYDIVAPTLKTNIVSVVIFFILLLIFYTIFKTIIYLIRNVFKIHFLIFTNRVAGFLIGSILGIFFVLLIIQILFILSNSLLLNGLFEKLMQSEIALNYYENIGVKLTGIFV